MTRLRSIIQDRLVHPNHLTLTLPRLQTTQQGVPIVTDLGQRAVEAVREGFSKAASDLINLGPGPDDRLPAESINTDSNSISNPQQLPSPPASPPMGRKRIPMPAGFPGYSSAAMDSPALIPTPGASWGESSRRSQAQSQSQQAQSSLRTPGGLAATGRTSSVAPSANSRGPESNSQFRFRGQFASQPPTPGPGMGTQPRVGALNSRAT
jgi:maintenance of morphology protein 1